MEINSNDLKNVLKNVLATVEGEASLLEKINAELIICKVWFKKNIAEEHLLNDENLMNIAKSIIICDAFRLALPKLDLVLTPNGFGVVSNQNIAPASKDRVMELKLSLMQTRDASIEILWNELKKNPNFGNTHIGSFLASTLFQDLNLSVLLGEEHVSYRIFIELHYSVMTLEYGIARTVISNELMHELRSAMFNDSLTPEQNALCDLIRNHIVNAIKKEEDINVFKSLAVTLIRDTPSLYEVWKDTKTAEVYKDYSFENNKKSGGVWI